MSGGCRPPSGPGRGWRFHKLDIYDAELYQVTDLSAWPRLARRLTFLDREPPESSGRSEFAVFEPDDGGEFVPILVLWIDPKKSPSASSLVNTIAHEAAHAASQLLDHLGHKLRGTDEPQAYLVGWIAQWLWEGVA